MKEQDNMNLEGLKERWQALAKEAGELLDSAHALRRQADDAKRAYETAHRSQCAHPTFFVRSQSYQEPPMRRAAEWEEKVCATCGEVLAQTHETKVWATEVPGTQVSDPDARRFSDDDEQ